jgi:hypothetical protein
MPRANALGGAVALATVTGLVGLLLLHFLEPPLALTWSFAHLHRRPALPWLAAALVVGLPLLTAWAWTSPALAAPPTPWRRRDVVLALGLGWAVLVVIGLTTRAPFVSLDGWYFQQQVVADATSRNARWYLTLWLMGAAARRLGTVLEPSAAIRVVNALWFALAVTAIAGAARRLARTRAEVAAVTALVLGAFGVFQLALGFVDIYPTALMIETGYLYVALAALDGARSPVWAAILLALGPFWYVGLVLLWPSALVLAVVVWRRDGWRQLGAAASVAVIVAGLATIPGYGAPFAWYAWAADLKAAIPVEIGLSPTSSLLPLWYVASVVHVRELLHLLILLDGVGALLLAVVGTWWLVRGGRPDARVTLLLAAIVPGFVYFVTMDPAWGAYEDWDLFSYLAAPPALLAAWAFVAWGREYPRVFPLLLGLALATSGVHLLARANAMDVDIGIHLKESPTHLGVPPGR